MNKLLQLPETQGFHKGNNEGLLMWSVPLYLKQANLLIFFIESNVFDNRSEGDDSLMSLMYCISSLIIFNVMGDINYKTMDVIQVMSTMKKKVQEIKIMSPSKNLWVFRDINEKIIKNNNTSQGQMIENRFLDIMKKATNEDKNNLQSFNEVFPEKMCVYCPKVLGYKGVGEEFLKSIENVKGLIEKEIPEKTLEGHSMNARMMLSFINSALEGIRDTNTIDLNFWYNN